MGEDFSGRLLHRLEQWRTSQGMSKTAMATLLRLQSPQAYINWTRRGSLPKEYFESAMTIVECADERQARAELRKPRVSAQPSRAPSTDLPRDDVKALAASLTRDQQLEAIGIFCRRLPPKRRLRFLLALLEELGDDLPTK